MKRGASAKTRTKKVGFSTSNVKIDPPQQDSFLE